MTKLVSPLLIFSMSFCVYAVEAKDFLSPKNKNKFVSDVSKQVKSDSNLKRGVAAITESSTSSHLNGAFIVKNFTVKFNDLSESQIEIKILNNEVVSASYSH